MVRDSGECTPSLWRVWLQQYWAEGGAVYRYVTPAQMRNAFAEHALGQELQSELAIPLVKTAEGDSDLDRLV